MIPFSGTHGKEANPSKALWLSVIWLFIAGSRPVSVWLHPGTDTSLSFFEGSPFDRNISAALILAALFVLVRRRTVATLLRANIPILLFMFYCGLSIFWSDFPDVAFKRWIRAMGDIAMILVVLTDPHPSAAFKGFLARMGFIVLPLSVLADIWRSASGLSYHYGIATNKNLYGMIGMILGLASVWRFLTILRRDKGRDRTRQLIAYLALVMAVLWCLWTANSTTSTVCFLLGSMLIVVTNRWSFARKPAVVHLVVVSLIFIAVYVSILDPTMGVISAMGKDPTLTNRTYLWESIIPLTPSPWFGAGFESFWLGPRLRELWDIFIWHPNEAHNGYIEVWVNLGWTGVVLLAFVMITGYRKIISGLRQDEETGSLRLAYFVVALIYSLTEVGFRIYSPVWIVFLLTVTASFKPRRERAKSQLATTVSGGFPEIWSPTGRRSMPVAGDGS